MKRSSIKTVNHYHPVRRIWAHSIVALRDDDADDEEGGGLGAQERKKAEQERIEVDDETKRKSKDILPTGRVVGVVKRNWRA